MDPEALLHSRPLAQSESVASPLPHLSNRDSAEEQEQNEGAMTDSGICYNWAIPFNRGTPLLRNIITSERLLDVISNYCPMAFKTPDLVMVD